MEKQRKPVLSKEQYRKLSDLHIKHQVYLQRVGATYAAQIWKIIDESGSEVCDYLRKRLAKFGAAAPDKATETKFKEIERRISEIRNASFREAEAHLKKSAIATGAVEVDFASTALSATMARGEVLKGLSDRALSNIANFGTFSGHTIERWMDGLAQSDLTRIMGQVRAGVVQGKTTDEIVKAIQGDPAVKYTNGQLLMTNRDAATIARTATNGMANSSRMAFYEANEDVIEAIQFVATLDSRTTLLCASLDGKQWKPGDPGIKQPPLHPNCRSVLMAVAKGFGLLGKRPAKDEDGNVKQVPAGTTYKEWFADQDEAFQKDVLGPTRFELYKKGGLEIDKFVDFGNDKAFTLGQLQRQDAEAFRVAGVEPKALEMHYGKVEDAKDYRNNTIWISAEDGVAFPKREPEFEPLREIYDEARKSPGDAIKYLRDSAQAQGVEYGVAYDKDGKWHSVAKGGPTAVQIPIPQGAEDVFHNHIDNAPPSDTDIRSFIQKDVRRMTIVVDKGAFVLTRKAEGDIIDENEFKRRWKADRPRRRDVSAEVLDQVLKVVLHGSGIDYNFVSA